MFTTCTGTTKYVTMRRNVPKEQRAVMDSAAVNSTDPAGTALRAGTQARAPKKAPRTRLPVSFRYFSAAA